MPYQPGRDQPERKAVGLGQGGAVHLVGQDVVPAHRISERHAAREVLAHLDLAHLLLAGIGAEEHDLPAAAAHLCVLQDRGQWRPRPAGVADGGGEPGEAMITGAFEGKHDLTPGAGFDVVEGKLEGASDRSADLERPRRLVDHRPVVVGDAEEALVRGQPGVEVLPPREVLDTGRRIGPRWRLVHPGDDLLTRPGRERPSQGRAEGAQSGDGRTAVGEKVTARN